MVEALETLPEPYEIFELVDGEVRELRITKYQLGSITIHPAHKPDGKVINALRVWVPKEIKPLYPDWWDITSKTLVAQLLPQLKAEGWAQKRYRITKHGIPPKARFTLEVRPA